VQLRWIITGLLEKHPNELREADACRGTGAGERPREQFKNRGIDYTPSDKSKSDLYRDMLPLLNSGRVVLPKIERSINQLANLERRVARSGKDSIDHAPGAHDDVANAVAGVDRLVTWRGVPTRRLTPRR
jgi:hypothetical protein